MTPVADCLLHILKVIWLLPIFIFGGVALYLWIWNANFFSCANIYSSQPLDPCHFFLPKKPNLVCQQHDPTYLQTGCDPQHVMTFLSPNDSMRGLNAFQNIPWENYLGVQVAALFIFLTILYCLRIRIEYLTLPNTKTEGIWPVTDLLVKLANKYGILYILLCYIFFWIFHDSTAAYILPVVLIQLQTCVTLSVPTSPSDVMGIVSSIEKIQAQQYWIDVISILIIIWIILMLSFFVLYVNLLINKYDYSTTTVWDYIGTGFIVAAFILLVMLAIIIFSQEDSFTSLILRTSYSLNSGLTLYIGYTRSPEIILVIDLIIYISTWIYEIYQRREKEKGNPAKKQNKNQKQPVNAV